MINWTETEARVADLKPYERNPRRISKEAYDRLKESIEKLGYHQRIVCQPDKSVIGGHQRIKVLKELGVEKIKILIPDRELNRDEFRRLLIADNLPFGEFDFEILSADFEAEELIDFGMPQAWLIGKEAEANMPQLANGEKSPFQQMTFTLHDSQAETVKAALDIASKEYKEDPNNQNGNGNALYFICSQFIEARS